MIPNNLFSFLVLATFCLVVFSSCQKKQHIHMLVHNASIYVVDDAFTISQAMAIQDGKIVETGLNQDLLKKYDADSVIDAGGKAIYPGLIDAHCHFTGYATDKWKCNLVGTKSFQEVVDSIVAYSAMAPSEWIYGRGWDQNDWDVKEFPNKKILDSLFPNRPVFLKRIDGHAALANQAALNRAGVKMDTILVGGTIEKKDSVYTGILIDNAMALVERAIPEISDSLAQQYFALTQKECFLQGLTGVHDCGISEKTLQQLEEAQKSGMLKMKVFALLRDEESLYDKWVIRGPYTNGLIHVGGFKVYADGTLGSRGACLLTDYSDQPGWKGFLLRDSTYYSTVAIKLIQSGLQMCTHAIGDSANRAILKIYAGVLKGKNDRRWRIEHAQVVNECDFHFFADFNIIPSVQPTHATSDMYWAGDRLGPDRVKNAYAYKRLMNTNGWIPLGTDFPVEYLSPIKTFYAAVIRKDGNDFPENGFQAENALTREQALRGMTIWAARAAFEEKLKGSLEPGKSADFIITDQDIMQIEPGKILKTKVLRTFINGQNVGL